MPQLEDLNKLFNFWENESSEIRTKLKKSGRKNTILEQTTFFELREALKKFNKHYMNDLQIILEATKECFPELCTNFPYLDKESIKKSILRGSVTLKKQEHRATKEDTIKVPFDPIMEPSQKP